MTVPYLHCQVVFYFNFICYNQHDLSFEHWVGVHHHDPYASYKCIAQNFKNCYFKPDDLNGHNIYCTSRIFTCYLISPYLFVDPISQT